MISSDPADRLEKMRAKKGLEFPTLMDPDLAVTKLYGLLNNSGKLPHPAALVIDQSGKITYLRVDEKYSKRPQPQELLDAIASGSSGSDDSTDSGS